MQRALLVALLEPTQIKAAEGAGDNTARLALQEEANALPFGLVWDEFCVRHNVPPADRWLAEVRNYEKRVFSERD
jgi:L-rhamnose isomerase